MAVFFQDFVNVTITNSEQECSCVERSLPRNIRIADLKGQLELMTGGSASTMKIEIYTKDNKYIGTCDDDEAYLGYYVTCDGMRLHVVDAFLQRKEFEDVSKVDKFEMSLEDYSKRPDTVKAFLERNKLGKYSDEEMTQRDEKKKKEEKANKIAAKVAKVGDRCEVRVPGQPARRATVMFIGKVDFQQGLWIGVKYDEPLGKNDGRVDGRRYFECYPKYGGFVKPTNITVGDFPEETMDTEDEI